MNYCVTIEQTRRIAVFFEEENDDLAGEAARISLNASPEDFLSGDEERDYALCNQDTGKTVLYWD